MNCGLTVSATYGVNWNAPRRGNQKPHGIPDTGPDNNAPRDFNDQAG